MPSRPPPLADRVQKRLPAPVADVVGQLRNEDVFLPAAGLAFYGLVSVAPFVILITWLAGLIVGHGAVHDAGRELARLTPNKVGADKFFVRVSDLGTRLGITALFALLWPATSYGAGLVRAFDRLSDRHRQFEGLRGRWLAGALLGVTPGAVLMSLAVTFAATRVVGKNVVGTVFGWVLAIGVAFVVTASVIALIYRLFTPEDLPWKAIRRGAVTAAAAIAVLSLAYVVYLRLGADFSNHYATSGLAAVVLLAVWLFLSNGLLLVGYAVAREES